MLDLLTPAEVRELTGKRTHPAQSRELAAMGMRHTLRRDGSPVVDRKHVDAILAGRTSKPAPPAPAGVVVNLAALRPRGKKAL